VSFTFTGANPLDCTLLTAVSDSMVSFFRKLQVINALAKSGEPGAAAKAERVLHNMVNRQRHGASEEVRATTINFNSVGYSTFEIERGSNLEHVLLTIVRHSCILGVRRMGKEWRREKSR
jgi:hypothetical protein